VTPTEKLAERLWRKHLQNNGTETQLNWSDLTQDYRFRWVEMAIEAELEIAGREVSDQ
jgi:hypothetical protein